MLNYLNKKIASIRKAYRVQIRINVTLHMNQMLLIWNESLIPLRSRRETLIEKNGKVGFINNYYVQNGAERTRHD